MLKGKVALVTGSTSGIGLGTAEVLAKQGVNLVIHGLVEQSVGEQLAADFAEKYQVKTFFSAANMASASDIKQLISETIERFGSLDILVNNAGIQYTERLENFPEEKWDAIIAINLSAAFHAMQAVLPSMQAHNYGRIINIASVHGLVASANKSAYVAAKHGLVGLTKVAAIENANYNISVNAICPGWVETPLIGQQIQDIADGKGIDIQQAKVELITQKQPKPEMAQASQIGEFVAFLCSDAASGITGASLPIDGAWTAQ